MRLIIFLSICFSLMGICSTADASSQRELEKQRHTFQLARKALETNQLNLFSQLRKKLSGYPLEGYLEYLYLRHRLNQVSAKTINNFLVREKNTFYAEHLRQVWLDRLAKEKNWSQYLNFYQTDISAEQDCNKLHALIATGHKQQAFSQTSDLWLVPHSQDKACDSVFDVWQKAGKLNDKLRWQRMLMALRNNQFAIARYLAKSMKSSTEALAWVDRWQTIHRHPLKLLDQLPATPPANPQQVSLAQDSELSREIILHGIERLARLSTEKAYQTWSKLEKSYHFSPQEVGQAHQSIGLRAALNRESEVLKYYGKTPGGEWHIRAALWQQNWPVVKNIILSLPQEQMSSTQWQYWLGRAQAELGQTEVARETFSRLIHERDYYSFLAADRLQQNYQMNHRPILASPSELAQFKNDPGIQRLHEFYALDMMLDARREAYYQRLTRSPRELLLMAKITHEWGWHNQTIAILGNAKYWDALDLRFPVLYDTEVRHASQKQGLDPSWLLAIARQESAFNPKAHSHVGAMGLMQLMPTTGKLISKLINKPLKQVSELYDSQRNIELGSAYLRKMYDENQHNPVLATAAYNAGPNRVDVWLPEQTLPADIWAENIPFNETRHYVKSVMSYAAIFDNQRNQKIKPLSSRMPDVNPKKP